MLEFRTTDTDELAPYSGMTADDLRDYEAWADEMDEQSKETLRAFLAALIVFCLAVALIAIH